MATPRLVVKRSKDDVTPSVGHTNMDLASCSSTTFLPVRAGFSSIMLQACSLLSYSPRPGKTSFAKDKVVSTAPIGHAMIRVVSKGEQVASVDRSRRTDKVPNKIARTEQLGPMLWHHQSLAALALPRSSMRIPRMRFLRLWITRSLRHCEQSYDWSMASMS